MKLPAWEQRLGAIGLVGERKAIALLFLGFYSSFFLLITLSARTELPELVPMFTGLTVIYLVTFFGAAAEWFFGRWVAIGVGYWGLSMAGWAFVTMRASLPPALVIFGAMHGLIALCLAGERMAASYEAQAGWRERFKLDDEGVVRVRRSVTRAASSLPALVMFALRPNPGEGMILCGLTLVGIVGLLRARTAGAIVLFGTGVGSVALALVGQAPMQLSAGAVSVLGGFAPMVQLPSVLLGFAGVMLMASALPFAKPILRFLRA